MRGIVCIAALLALTARADEHENGFTGIAHAGRVAFISAFDGRILSLDGKTVSEVISTEHPLRTIAVSADARVVAACGDGVVARSEDGGRIFHIEPLPLGERCDAVAFVPDGVVVFTADGQGYLLTRMLHFERLSLPRKTHWRAASFDGVRGFVVGDAGALIATDDGGRTWTQLRAPDPLPKGVLLEGGRLFVSGRDGVFRSDDGGLKFRHLFVVPGVRESMCEGFGHKGAVIAVACAPIGRALFVSAAGEHFDEVKVPEAGELHAASVAGEDELVAVGEHELIVMANARYGSLLVHSDEVRHWQRSLRVEEERAARSQTVPTRSAKHPASVDVVGKVADEHDRPVEGVELAAASETGNARTKTRADGSFELRLPFGSTVNLRVFADGFSPIDRALTPDASGFVDASLRLEREVSLSGSLRGRDGQPVSGGLRLYALPPPAADTGEWIRTATPIARASVGPDGAFSFRGLRASQYVLEAEAAGVGPFSTYVRAPDDEVTLTATRGGRIFGRVLDAQDRPVRDAAVELFADGAASASASASTRTDAEGQFSFVSVADGTFDVRAVVEAERVCVKRRASVASGLAPEVTIRLGRGAQIRGSVIDRTGAPVVGAAVLGATDEDPICGARSATTDARGEFVLPDVIDSAYVVSALVTGEKISAGESVPQARARPGATVRLVVRR